MRSLDLLKVWICMFLAAFAAVASFEQPHTVRGAAAQCDDKCRERRTFVAMANAQYCIYLQFSACDRCASIGLCSPRDTDNPDYTCTPTDTVQQVAVLNPMSCMPVCPFDGTKTWRENQFFIAPTLDYSDAGAVYMCASAP